MLSELGIKETRRGHMLSRLLDTKARDGNRLLEPGGGEKCTDHSIHV